MEFPRPNRRKKKLTYNPMEEKKSLQNRRQESEVWSMPLANNENQSCAIPVKLTHFHAGGDKWTRRKIQLLPHYILVFNPFNLYFSI